MFALMRDVACSQWFAELGHDTEPMFLIVNNTKHNKTNQRAIKYIMPW